MALLAVLAAQSLPIEPGTHFFDGANYFTVKEVRMGTYVWMTTSDDSELTLEKTDDSHFKLIPSRQAEDPIFGADFGAQVNYGEAGGTKYLTLHNDMGEMVWILHQTSLSADQCDARQAQDSEQELTYDLISSRLLNMCYLMQFSKQELRLKRNEVFARHGYRFNSPDLQRRFSSYDWYRPGDDNSSVSLSHVEQVNVALMKRAEYIAEDDLEYEDTPGVTEASREVAYVSNEVDFIAALNSNTIIEINAGTTLNLSKVLNRRDFFELGDKRAYTFDFAGQKESDRPYAVSYEVFQGRELVLLNLRNVTIRGGANVSIVVEPQEANVLRLVNCRNVEIKNVTMGHLVEGHCDGNVVCLEECADITLSNCDLFGCGAYGIHARRSSNIKMEHSVIRDCSYGIMEIYDCTQCEFIHCDFLRNRQFGLIDVNDNCYGISFSDCNFAENTGKLFDLRSTVNMSGCKVAHADQTKLGDTSLIEQDAENRWTSDVVPHALNRGLGPK